MPDDRGEAPTPDPIPEIRASDFHPPKRRDLIDWCIRLIKDRLNSGKLEAGNFISWEDLEQTMSLPRTDSHFVFALIDVRQHFLDPHDGTPSIVFTLKQDLGLVRLHEKERAKAADNRIDEGVRKFSTAHKIAAGTDTTKLTKGEVENNDRAMARASRYLSAIERANQREQRLSNGEKKLPLDDAKPPQSGSES